MWTGLGIAAAELLLVALAVTNHYRRRLSHIVWRRAHYANFACGQPPTLHGMGSGTDRNAPAMIALYAVASAAVLALTTWRIAQHRPGVARLGLKSGRRRKPRCCGVLALMSGPLSPHNRPFNARTFSDVLTGTILQRSGSTKAIVSMTGNGSGRQNVLVRADLLVGANSLEATSFQLEFLPNGTVCRGSVTNVQSFGFDGVCRMPDHTRRTVHARWQATSTRSFAARSQPTTPEPGYWRVARYATNASSCLGVSIPPPVRHAHDRGLPENASRHDHVFDLLRRVELRTEVGTRELGDRLVRRRGVGNAAEAVWPVTVDAHISRTALAPRLLVPDWWERVAVSLLPRPGGRRG